MKWGSQFIPHSQLVHPLLIPVQEGFVVVVSSGGENGIEYFIDRRRSISPCCCYWPTFIAVDWAGIDGWID